MAPVTSGRGSRWYVFYAHLARLASRLGPRRLLVARLAPRRGVEAPLLRLVHLLPHKVAEHEPQHLGQHVPYKEKNQQQREREEHELFKKKGNLRRVAG